MIRHRRQDEFLLVTQDNHARLSGALASLIGNSRFAAPSPREEVITAITMHDAGWPLHDDQPGLNGEGFPMHVFETPPELGARIWSESVRLAALQGDYVGLLVSLHVMALSSIAQSHLAGEQNRLLHARDLFEMNKFQQNQIEAQENFRRRLGLRTDVALRYGLPTPGSSPEEDLLLFNYNLLKAMDRISLAALCSEPIFDSVDGIFQSPGSPPIELRLSRAGEFALRIDPWPFERSPLEFAIPVRRIPARKYADAQELQAVLAQAPAEEQSIRIVGAA